MFFFKPTGQAKIPSTFLNDEQLSFAVDSATVAFEQFFTGQGFLI
jgi:hypothetical protein